MTLKYTIHRQLALMDKQYGPQGWWPGLVMEHAAEGEPRLWRGTWSIKHGATPSERFLKKKSEQVFEVAIGAILTQNTSWSNVEKALVCLAKKKLLTPQAIMAARPSTLATCIRSSGYFRQKAKKLKIFAKFVMKELEGDLTSLARHSTLNASRHRRGSPSAARSTLLSLWGIGPETADTILLYGLNQRTFVVDAYTRRWLVHLTKNRKWFKAPYEEMQDLFVGAGSPRPGRGNRAPTKRRIIHQFQQSHALIVKWGKEKTSLT